LGVPKQLANYRQAKAAARTEGRIRVAQIVQANALQASTSGDSFPWTFQIGARFLGTIAWHDVGADTFQAGQHRHRWSVQDHRLSTALAVGEEQQPALKIDVLPPQMQDFPQAAAREEQQPDRRGREGTDLSEAVLRFLS
jgi:hypothetical protein